MKAITQVRLAAHLMAHIEDLQEMGNLNAQDVHIIQDALLLLIRNKQQETTKNQIDLLVRLPHATKTYELHQRNDAPNAIIVSEAGSQRRLKHVPIFAYRFDIHGLPALDAALAILADFMGEDLSMRAFAAGNAQYCFYYRAFAKNVLPRGHFETKHIVAFLQHESQNGRLLFQMSEE